MDEGLPGLFALLPNVFQVCPVVAVMLRSIRLCFPARHAVLGMVGFRESMGFWIVAGLGWLDSTH